jgi:hypothetical protein
VASGSIVYGPPDDVLVVTVVVTVVELFGVEVGLVPAPERIESNRCHAPGESGGATGVTAANSTGTATGTAYGTATGTGTSVPPAKVMAMTALVSGASGKAVFISPSDATARSLDDAPMRW